MNFDTLKDKITEKQQRKRTDMNQPQKLQNKKTILSAVQPETIAHRFDIKDNTTIVEEEEA